MSSKPAGYSRPFDAGQDDEKPPESGGFSLAFDPPERL
jgi:hypothetical protein